MSEKEILRKGGTIMTQKELLQFLKEHLTVHTYFNYSSSSSIELTVRLCLDGEEISYSQDSFQIN